MALLSSPPLSIPKRNHHYAPNPSNPRLQSSVSTTTRAFRLRPIAASHVCTTEESLWIDKSSLIIAETVSEDELWASACLRVRSFYEFEPSTYGVQDHKTCLAEREFEALKERVAGKRSGFTRVSCINATLPLSHLSSISDDLCAVCKFTVNGEDRVVVGSLDINQCLRLPDEIAGMKPEGIGADFARAYLSNVCVAREMHRNGLGYELVEKSKRVAQEWGISDLYVHVAVDNEPAKKLYMKSGFIYEDDEPAWQARFLDRPRRILLWIGLPGIHDL
ncbi:Acetyltransf_1 domain-containing protein [Cephalotus follicularis]|uniref:Acetyltransf_1 domain-containing protein n=1 Tax=Cephalotus follicularis TaxID=3775 RepID=A0A1Q3DEP0_CEPFO|nr:Acetyltransf_1 domain-containing protein [Cephalotus follicularis]